MIIRAQQMQVLARHSRERANRQLGEYAGRRFPDVWARRAEEERLAFAEAVRSSAEENGFDRDDHVATWLDLVVMYDLDFPASPWASPILQDKELSTDGKIEALAKAVRKSGAKL